MTAIYQSPFLIALGWTIAASIWQSALLWLIYQAICSLHRKISPSHKHFIAAVLLLGSFGWFSVTLTDKYSKAIKLSEYLSGQTAHSNTATTMAYSPDTLFSQNGLTDFANQYLPYISAGYLIVLLLLSIKLIRAYLYSKQLQTKGLLEPDRHWITLVNNYAQKIGITKKVRICLSRYISVPATLSFFKPVILLPLAAFNHLTVQQAESIILHELAHIKRNDYLINIIVSVIETILFFNPFVHLLSKSLKKEREHCCDDFVLRHRFDPHSYATALLSLEQLRVGLQPLAIAATGKNSHQLLARIKRIMNVSTTNFNYGQKLLALVLMSLMMISVAWLSPSSENNGFSFPEAIYNGDTNPADQLMTTAPTIAENKTTRTLTLPAKDRNMPGGASHAKTKQAGNANAPAFLPRIVHLTSPVIPGEVWEIPHPPVAPPAPQLPFNENNDISWAPESFAAPVLPADVFDNYDFSFNLQNDLIKLMEDAKIKSALFNNQSLNGEQLRVLINTELYKEQLQLKGAIKNRKQLSSETNENKVAGNARKNSTAARNSMLSFFNPLAEKLPDIKRALAEEKAKLDSFRKASVELAEKQKEIWLRQAKEKNKAGENEEPVAYEFIMHVDDNTPLQPATVKRLQQNVSITLHSKKAERERRTNGMTSNKNISAFTITPSQDNKAINAGADDYRAMNTARRQRMVISL
ncbi:M56 family metallopeptidase [Agriterribacter sp.]|uniref:M56 family metallopeptidase n=1 Tax=Agriterribacter sp. TaxID=2821509 RepID=UPI002C0E94A9|nr:M56 family metallopeptidase [Agriterribacter sp.]HTN07346.1 M56 family metallopeptidase [Agriterribacter sp.]